MQIAVNERPSLITTKGSTTTQLSGHTNRSTLSDSTNKSTSSHHHQKVSIIISSLTRLGYRPPLSGHRHRSPQPGYLRHAAALNRHRRSAARRPTHLRRHHWPPTAASRRLRRTGGVSGAPAVGSCVVAPHHTYSHGPRSRSCAACVHHSVAAH